MKKKVDGVVVEAKSILTALKIIKTVCEDNNCSTCPFGKNDFFCSITDTTPNAWKINSDINGNGVEVEKTNDSVVNLQKTTATMLKILADLRLKDPVPEPEKATDGYL